MNRDSALTTITPTARLNRAFWAAGLALLCSFGWAVLALTHQHDPRVSGALLGDGRLHALALCFVLAGLFVLVHRAQYALGLLFLISGTLYSLRLFVQLAAALAGAGPGAGDAIAVLVLVSDVAYALTIYGLPLFLPDGRLPRGRGRLLFPLVALWSLVVEYYFNTRNPDWYGVPAPLYHSGFWHDLARPFAAFLTPAGKWIAPAVVLLGLLVALVRWRRSSGPHLRILGVLVPYLAYVLITFGYYLAPFLSEDWLYTVVTFGWAAGLAYAFTGDRSVYLDRATRRVLAAFSFLTLLFVTVGLFSYLMVRLLPAAAETEARWLALIALTTGLLLRPAARGVMQAVDRYYYGKRAQPYQVVRRLAERLSLAVDPGEAPGLLCATVVSSLGVPGARVTISTLGGMRELARSGDCPEGAERLPLRYEGAEIGELHIAPRPGQRALDRQDREVLGFLADQAAPAIASLRLYAELQSSRKRIVVAREEERRRLRHDLHDGIGPALSGLRLQVDTARSATPDGSPLAASLNATSEGIGRAITELRRITDGLAPAALDSEGLTSALRQLAGGLDGRRLHVTVEMHPDPLPALPAAVEVALFRISGEALNNVVRHSGATDATLTVRVEDEHVTVSARDNGAGFPAHTQDAGVGLRSMAERAEELGGEFRAANDATGAVVTASIPRTPVPVPLD